MCHFCFPSFHRALQKRHLGFGPQCVLCETSAFVERVILVQPFGSLKHLRLHGKVAAHVRYMLMCDVQETMSRTLHEKHCYLLAQSFVRSHVNVDKTKWKEGK